MITVFCSRSAGTWNSGYGHVVLILEDGKPLFWWSPKDRHRFAYPPTFTPYRDLISVGKIRQIAECPPEWYIDEAIYGGDMAVAEGL